MESWRRWKTREDWEKVANIDQWDNLDKELRTWQITIHQDPEILRWDYTIKGTFTITEAYDIQA